MLVRSSTIRAYVRSLLEDDGFIEIIRGAGSASVIRVTASLVAFGSIILLARIMGSSEFGRYSFALAWMTMLAYPATLGLPAVALRFVAHYVALGDDARLIGVIKTSLLIALAFGLVVTLLGLAIVFCLRSYIDPGHFGALMPALLGIPILAISLTVSEAVRGLRWFWLAWSPIQIGQPIVLLMLVGVMLTVRVPHAPEVMIAAVVAYGIMLLVQLRMLWARLGGKARVKSKIDVRLWIRTALPFVWSFGATMVLAQAGTVLVGIFRSPAETAAYNVAASTSLLVTFTFQAAVASSAPQFAALHAHGRYTELRSLFSRLVRWTFWPSLAMTLALVLFASPILRLFGPDFDRGYLALVVLAFGQLTTVLAGPVASLLGMTGHQKTLAQALTGAAIVYVLVGSLFTQFWGMTGAALALCAVLAGSNAWLVRAAIHNLDIDPFGWMGGTALRREGSHRSRS
jgi:O-antigen/teichoic acid export membrane protein